MCVCLCLEAVWMRYSAGVGVGLRDRGGGVRRRWNKKE